MKYPNIKEGIFESRPNRFVAYVTVDGVSEKCHVKNTGRLRELLIPGALCYLCRSDNPARTTRYDLVAVKRFDGVIVNIDSMAPNTVARQYLQSLFPKAAVRAEVQYQNSRFDFSVDDGEKVTYVEVKGVTLDDEGVARFPDAPTERGCKHLYELIDCKKKGYGAMVLFVVPMPSIRYVAPNRKTHPAFADALQAAKDAGVILSAVQCRVTLDEILPQKALEVVPNG